MLARSIPLAETLAGLRRGENDLQKHVHAVCDRMDESESDVQALVPESGRRDRLLEEAAKLQARFPDPAMRPLLFGALVGVKDIFHVDGFTTRAGTRVPPDLFAGAEAECVWALRRSGVLILGKTVTTEFAYFEPGPTGNPHNLGHTPGGSSSGSAAAVAAGFCPLALGTQTIGSVIRPAAFCGIVGFKPSFGRIPTAGLVYYSKSIDQIGVFTQDVIGQQLVASVLCRDWAGWSSAGRPVLGVPEGPYLEQAEPSGLEAFFAQEARLQEAGYEVRRVVALDDIAEINQRHRQLAAAEMAQEHASWFDAHEALYRPRTAELIKEGREVRDDVVERGRAGGAELRTELEKLMRQNGIDMWICPAAPGTAPTGLENTGDPALNLPWTHAGLPVLSLPAGKAVNGLPLGLQCVAGFMQDEALLAWGEELAEVLVS
jgi:Asp-tRNA(Asn)/Glu-tRNA(Gln) amidotransferase A subunit family amidase